MTDPTGALLTSGNAAKLFALEWLDRLAASRPKLTMVDLGCGTAKNFSALLRRHRHVRYIGIEPSPQACAAARQELAGLDAVIHNSYAYGVVGRLIPGPVDVAVSFSVFEHVYRRQAYLDSLRACVVDGGWAVINYDNGHFLHPEGMRERLKNLVGPVLARLGSERWYQSFVALSAFETMAAQAGLAITERKVFNSPLKSIYREVPPSQREAYMRRWLDTELWINELGITADDASGNWMTRHFLLQPTPVRG